MEETQLQTVERQLSKGVNRLRFDRAIEELYLRDYTEHRVRRAPIWALVGTFIYDLVFFGDATMVPDQLDALMLVRFGIFTPFAVVVTFLAMTRRNARDYDLLSLAIVLVGGALPMLVAMHSTSEDLFTYQTGNVATFLFLVVGLRPRFPSLIAGLILLSAIHLTICWHIPSFDSVTFQGLVTFYVTISIFLGLGAYFQEHSERMNFLNCLHATSLHQQLQWQSDRDELTGLLNRRSLVRIERQLWQSVESCAVFAMMLDIDRFKLFNDVHGHLDGDDCLRAVARAINNSVGTSASVFRFGGEEILILMPDARPDEAHAAAERIRLAIEDLAIRHEGLSPPGVVTASIGTAGGETKDLTLQDLLRRADKALYEAKKQGRNRVVPALAPLERLAAAGFAVNGSAS
ncbi:GGDEF domain-containing protein [Rhizobium wuzhouense]|uniref:diguanylate cyclase n=1 Tax=Rhizobium wuzhouense TaxID=1986026 RepID=A0ABX5NNN8_9HYPH|nr:GGDEF domain-containing protein [Rhizobium wuzhouense]PYB71192.1 GGDEF domain-containing protein [Rhizobium wuzhouense]